MAIGDGLPEEFLRHFAAWVRLEPRSRVRDFGEGVAARTADPLWMLARQWQMGELKADDAGSPLRVELTYRTQPVDSLRRGEDGVRERLDDMPIEILAEREPFPMTWRERVRIGQEFERRARSALGGRAQALIDFYRGRYGLRPPPAKQWVAIDRETRAFIELLNGRVIDGKALLDARGSGEPLPRPDGISGNEIGELFDQLQKWLTALHSEPPADLPRNAWVGDELAYRFELNPPSDGATGTQLVADNYRSGDFDWYSVKGKTNVQGAWTEVKDPIKASATRISVGGTSPRWWAFEDAKTDFGDLDVGTPDLAKLLLMEFVFAHGDDWFSVPLPVRTGHLVQVSRLKVFNVFGEDPIKIESARRVDGDPMMRWEVFTVAREGEYDTPGIGPCLYVPRVAAYREESPPLEEVRFLRDEGANMVWGVEHLLPNGLGKPARGFEAHVERRDVFRKSRALRWLMRLREKEIAAAGLSDTERAAKQAELDWMLEQLDMLEQPPTTASQQAALKYRLATTVPDNWIPFVPAGMDKIHFRDGTTLEGKITVREASRIKLRYDSREEWFDLADVERIERNMRLNRSQMLRNADGERPAPVPALSRLLGTWRDPLLWLEEYTVPRVGVQVLLTKQRVRDFRGRTFVWLAKKVLTGRGEGASGLAFYVVDTNA